MNAARRLELETFMRAAVAEARTIDWEIGGDWDAERIVKQLLDTIPPGDGEPVGSETESALVAGRYGRFEVFTVIERNCRSYWSKLGRAYLNKDGSINVFLDALPTNGKLQVRAEGSEVPK